MPKTAKEKFKTRHSVFDEFTNRNIFKLITQGHFDGLQSPVSTGKESNIFSALKDQNKIIVKIYRLETADFKRMHNYIKNDPRFQGLTKNRRKVIFAWAQREYRNLILAREADVRVPKPITFLNNVLVMEFIGNKEIALQLKDDPPKNPETFFNDIINQIKKLYRAGLVHGDLSHFNILNYNEKPVIIDLSHGTPLRDHNAAELLERDISTIINFFKKVNLKVDKEQTINKIIK